MTIQLEVNHVLSINQLGSIKGTKGEKNKSLFNKTIYYFQLNYIFYVKKILNCFIKNQKIFIINIFYYN